MMIVNPVKCPGSGLLLQMEKTLFFRCSGGEGGGKKDVKPCLSHSWHLPTDPANVTGRAGDTDVPIPNPGGRTPVGDDMFD
jgi:hypothetical protein